MLSVVMAGSGVLACACTQAGHPTIRTARIGVFSHLGKVFTHTSNAIKSDAGLYSKQFGTEYGDRALTSIKVALSKATAVNQALGSCPER